MGGRGLAPNCCCCGWPFIIIMGGPGCCCCMWGIPSWPGNKLDEQKRTRNLGKSAPHLSRFDTAAGWASFLAWVGLPSSPSEAWAAGAAAGRPQEQEICCRSCQEGRVSSFVEALETCAADRGAACLPSAGPADWLELVALEIVQTAAEEVDLEVLVRAHRPCRGCWQGQDFAWGALGWWEKHRQDAQPWAAAGKTAAGCWGSFPVSVWWCPPVKEAENIESHVHIKLQLTLIFLFGSI